MLELTRLYFMKPDRRSPSPIPSTRESPGCVTTSFGSLVAPILACFLLHVVYGVDRRDSSAVWLLSGVADLIVSVCCLPAFWLSMGICSMIFKPRKDDASASIINSLGVSLVLYTGVVILAWYFTMEGGRVLKAN